MRRDTNGLGKVAPTRPASDLCFVVAEIEEAAAAEADILAVSATKRSQRSRLLVAMGSSRASRFCWRHQPQFGSIAPPRYDLSRAEPSSVALRKEISGEGANNSAANDDDICLLRRGRRVSMRVNGCGHWKSPCLEPTLGIPGRMRNRSFCLAAENSGLAPCIEILCAVSYFAA